VKLEAEIHLNTGTVLKFVPTTVAIRSFRRNIGEASFATNPGDPFQGTLKLSWNMGEAASYSTGWSEFPTTILFHSWGLRAWQLRVSNLVVQKSTIHYQPIQFSTPGRYYVCSHLCSHRDCLLPDHHKVEPQSSLYLHLPCRDRLL